MSGTLRNAVVLGLVIGCGGKDDGDPKSTGTGTGTGTGCMDTSCPVGTTGGSTTPAPPELLESPAEAADLDPDPSVLHVQLTAAPHSFAVGEQVIDGYAYNGQVPGPTLRAKLGDTLVVELSNELADPTTIHWHGVEVPWAMDGVTWMQSPVDPGQSFEYRFVLEQAGTFWYHPHFDTAHQVDHGLYGVLVVEDPADPVVDEAIWVFDSWGEEAWAETHTHLPDPTARTWTVNGLVLPEWAEGAISGHRVRILNASNAGYLWLDQVSVIGGDQGLLANAGAPTEVVLGPGDRAELAWNAGVEVLQTLPWAAAGGPAWGDPIPLLTVPAETVWTWGAVDWAPTLAPPSADPGGAAAVWVLHGDTQGESWMINGETFPAVTIPEVGLGGASVLEVRNLSAAEHPFHVHGMSFEVLSVDGVPPAFKTVEDTWNVRIGETVRLLVSPPRAGDWMAHCHILPHAEEGMMTVLRVQ